MPKLAARDLKKVSAAEAVAGGGFALMAPGRYIATLKEVEARTSNAGNPVWNCTFHEIHNLEGEKQSGQQWYNLNMPLGEKAPDTYTKGQDKWDTYQRLSAGRIKAFFEAFGYEENSDTDEMIGEKCLIQVGVRTIQQGAKAGEKTNETTAVLPLDPNAAEVVKSNSGDDETDSW